MKKQNKIAIIGLFFALVLGGCANNKALTSDKVFTNARIQYQTKQSTNKIVSSKGLTPSYFMDIAFDPEQVKLSRVQLKQVDDFMAKVDYPDEYTVYISIGLRASEPNYKKIEQAMNRGKALKALLQSKVKEVQIALLPNQQSDSAYIRLLA